MDMRNGRTGGVPTVVSRYFDGVVKDLGRYNL